MTIGKVISLNIGRVKSLGEEDILSGIMKSPVTNKAIYLSTTHLDGDEQADLIHHGGVDKAVCVYPFEHYSYWEDILLKKLQAGAFGENLTLFGLNESSTYVGDIYEWGEARVQVSQPRQPCFKLAKRHGYNKLPKCILETGFSGYYLRVLKEGYVYSNKPLVLVERKSNISIELVNQITFHNDQNFSTLDSLLRIPELSDAWKENIQKKIKNLESKS